MGMAGFGQCHRYQSDLVTNCCQVRPCYQHIQHAGAREYVLRTAPPRTSILRVFCYCYLQYKFTSNCCNTLAADPVPCVRHVLPAGGRPHKASWPSCTHSKPRTASSRCVQHSKVAACLWPLGIRLYQKFHACIPHTGCSRDHFGPMNVNLDVLGLCYKG